MPVPFVGEDKWHMHIVSETKLEGLTHHNEWPQFLYNILSTKCGY